MFISRAITRSLTLPLRYFVSSRILDPMISKKEKKHAYLRLVKPQGDMSDTLTIVGLSNNEILGLWESLRKETEVVLSSENIGFVLFQFDRLGVLT